MIPEIIFECGKNFVTTEEEQPEEVLFEYAKKLIDSAKECGAKIVKFQVHTVEDEVHPNINITSPHFDHDRYSWVKRNSYSVEFWQNIKKYCETSGIEFLATPMSRGAAILLNEEIGVERWKIGSGDILDFPMLDYIRDIGRPIILSSGMSTLGELKLSYDYLKEKTNDITILHCVSQYPCPVEKLNLNTIPFLKKEFPGVPIGFSDHSVGIQGALIASSLGVSIIEKHFTLDKKSWGPDHQASSTPEEMKQLVDILENEIEVELRTDILGNTTKYLQPEEQVFRPSFRKGLYASKDLRKDEMYEADMIISLRPQAWQAEPSQKYPKFLGKFVQEDIKKYEPIK